MKGKLKYVEEHIEELLAALAQKRKYEVEVIIEEEREETEKLRIITVSPNGEGKEETEVLPKPVVSRKLPKIKSIKAKLPPKITKFTYITTKEITARANFPKMFKLAFPLANVVLAFSREIKELVQVSLPFIVKGPVPWSKSAISLLNMYLQLGVTAYVMRELLRLRDVSLKFIASKPVEVKVSVPEIYSERFVLQKPARAEVKEIMKSLRGIAEAQVLKGANMLSFILESEEEKVKDLLKVASEYVGEPIVIVLPESKEHLWYLFWIACRELYREVRGKLPESIILLGSEKKEHEMGLVNLPGLELWLRISGSISGKIIVAYEDYLIKNEEARKWLKRRFIEAFTQGLGFLILLSRNVEKTEDALKKLFEPYEAKILSFHTIPSPEEMFEKINKTLNMTFGISYPIYKPGMYDLAISYADRKYRDFVEAMLSSDYVAYVRRDISEHESEDHLALKTLAIKYLHEKMNVKLENIKCTCKINENIVADIFVENKAIAIECETLFGTGPAPILKIFETIRKYIENRAAVNEIWVIIRNWQVFLHLGDIYWAWKILEKEMESEGLKIKVKMFVPDIPRRELKPLDKVFKEFKSYIM